MKITVLGSGTSHGIPVIGCSCPVCTSSDPKDKRTRTSVWITHKETSILIDTAPELRLQAVKNGMDRLDAVLLTHPHADHIHGLDDLRPLTWENRIPVYGNEDTIKEVRKRFSYIFEKTQIGGGKPRIDLQILGEGPLQVKDLTIIPVPVYHGELLILGFRVGDFAYVTDCSAVPEESFDLLKGISVLIMGALRETPHATHFSIAQACEAIERIAPRRAYLTHMSHEVSNQRVMEITPPNTEPAWDNMVIELTREL